MAEATDRTRRTETLAPWLGGSTDIGRRHRTNQDAFALAVPGSGRAVIVVSDGVSSSLGAERASAVASQTVCDHLARNIDLPAAELHEEMRVGYRLANDAVMSQGGDGSPVGSCTLVVAVVRGAEVAVANVGDTRAYWIADGGRAMQLSVDDSMAQARIDLGMTRQEAETSAQAHAITKWLGPQAPDLVPRVTTMVAEEPGWLLVCSDGLWNYASDPDAMAYLLRQLGSAEVAADAGAVAAALVGWANEQGGRDNITAAVARIDPDQPSA